MAGVKYAAAGFTFMLGTTAIGGIDSFELDGDVQRADTTTFDDVGVESHIVTRRSKTLKLTGKKVFETADVGQAAVETLATKVGADAVGAIDVKDAKGTSVVKFNATVKMDAMGGGNNDSVKWGCTFTRTGADVTGA